MVYPPDELTPATLALLADLERLTGQRCQVCPRVLCGHEVLFSVALGCKDAPRCLGCLAGGLQRSIAELRQQLVDHFRGRDCFQHAWDVACVREGSGRTVSPHCLEGRTPTVQANEPPVEPSNDIVSQWNAGDLACGDLVLALRRRLNELPPGSVLEVIALDPAAPEDLPAWCRLTGHTLEQAVHPSYRIRRRER